MNKIDLNFYELQIQGIQQPISNFPNLFVYFHKKIFLFLESYYVLTDLFASLIGIVNYFKYLGTLNT